MPLIRFALFASGLIVCGFLASNYLLASNTNHRSDMQVSAQTAPSSLAGWRDSEARKTGRAAEAAIVLPAMPQTLPTAERLAFERQLASNTVPAAILAQSESSSVASARAEMTEASPQRSSTSQQLVANKPKRKQNPRPEIATAERGPPPRESGGFFGGIFSN